MRKAKYVKPGLFVVDVTGARAFLSMSNGVITDDPATEPAMAKEYDMDFDMDEDVPVSGGYVNLWDRVW